MLLNRQLQLTLQFHLLLKSLLHLTLPFQCRVDESRTLGRKVVLFLRPIGDANKQLVNRICRGKRIST